MKINKPVLFLSSLVAVMVNIQGIAQPALAGQTYKFEVIDEAQAPDSILKGFKFTYQGNVYCTPASSDQQIKVGDTFTFSCIDYDAPSDSSIANALFDYTQNDGYNYAAALPGFKAFSTTDVNHLVLLWESGEMHLVVSD